MGYYWWNIDELKLKLSIADCYWLVLGFKRIGKKCSWLLTHRFEKICNQLTSHLLKTKMWFQLRQRDSSGGVRALETLDFFSHKWSLPQPSLLASLIIQCLIWSVETLLFVWHLFWRKDSQKKLPKNDSFHSATLPLAHFFPSSVPTPMKCH